MSRKKIIFTVLLACITYAAIEAFAYGLYYAMEGKKFSVSDIQSRQNAIMDSLQARIVPARTSGHVLSSMVLHPYFGQVHDPEVVHAEVDALGTKKLRKLMSPYGLQAEQDPFIASRDTNTAIIAITGGSVSEFLFGALHDFIHAEMEKLPQFHDKKIDVIMLGRSGFHQPQQLLCVALYLMQGGRLDMLINLDGYNEIQVPVKLQGDGVYPYFPLLWKGMLYQASGSLNLAAVGNIRKWEYFQEWAVRILKPLDFSVTGAVLWSFIDHYCEREKVQAEKAMDERDKQKLSYEVAGPDTFKDASKEELLHLGVNGWIESSRQLQALATAYHFHYFHFLQPNQYVADSKIFTSEESAMAYLPDDVINRMIMIGYPLLEAGIETLHQQGENAYSLTGIYKDVPDTIYRDSCCHVNQRGNQIMAEAIIARIAAYFYEHQGQTH